MAQPNTQSSSSPPHPLSLKVLRLSRPSLATRTPLSATSFSPASLNIQPEATQAYPSTDPSSTSSPLTPLLTLPASFGAAYVGEIFSCTLCVNNDLEAPSSDNNNTTTNKPTITSVRTAASLQTPSNPTGFPLDLQSTSEQPETSHTPFPPTSTLQSSLSHSLKEPGPHVLAVTVAYTSTSLNENGVAIGSAARTFRKLYQFVAQPVLAVRSKIGGIAAADVTAGKGRRWVLEAQLENVGGEGVVIERCFLKAGKEVFWRGGIEGGDEGGSEGEEVGGGGGRVKSVVLRPRDVQQVMFLVEDREEGGGGGAPKALAQVDIDWRSAMGEKGRLTTGWLAARG